MSDDAVVWVVGAGGLLGSAVVRHLTATGRARVMAAEIPWADEGRAIEALARGVDTLADSAAGGAWALLWCAGTGVPATPQPQLDAERRVLTALLDNVALRVANGLGGPGVVFLASSAGAVYSGSSAPPYDERSTPVPLAHYGVAKLAQEAAVRDFTARTGVASLVGRISNLYGPGQNLAKPQGIISQLCRAHLTGQPTSIYVSMDTIRDYLFAADCAAKIIDAAELVQAEPGHGRSMTKVFASGQAVTIGAVLGECRRVFKRRPRVVLGSSALASVQARDLRLRSVVAPEIDRRTLTPLGAGIGATVNDLSLAFQAGRLSAR